MAYRLEPVTGATIGDAPDVCVGCVFWQSRIGRTAAKPRWAERIEEDWGPWGTIYQGDGGRLLGFVQYGPAGHFPRAFELPGGPPSADAVLVTCAYLVDLATPWVLQSLFLAAIGEARDRGVKAIETFGYRYPEATSSSERFLVHRWEGDVCLARLELGGLVPVEEGLTARAWRRMKEAFTPAPMPKRP